MGDPDFVDWGDPDAAFAALSDGTRVAILRALWDAEGHEATFSDLRDAVGVDDSGQFNYHLDKLADRFVTRTDEGWALTQAGMQVNGAIEAGAYTAEGSIDPVPVDGPCPACGGDRTLYYEDETVRVECDGCPFRSKVGIPPGALVGYDRAAIPEVAGRYLRSTLSHITDGFCSFCDGRVEPSVVPMDDLLAERGIPDDADPEVTVERVEDVPWVRFDCRRCGAEPAAGLGLALLDHPAVVGFHHDRGVDVRERSVWEFAGWDTGRSRVRERDPLRAAVTYEADGDALTLVVDADLSVVGTEGPTG